MNGTDPSVTNVLKRRIEIAITQYARERAELIKPRHIHAALSELAAEWFPVNEDTTSCCPVCHLWPLRSWEVHTPNGHHPDCAMRWAT